MHGPYITDPAAEAALLRDGFGWREGDGLYLAGAPRRPSGPSGFWHWLKRRLRMARLEHVNVTVKDPDETAAMLTDLFGWRVLWRGDAIHGGRSIHVGTGDDYLAVYAGPEGQAQRAAGDSYTARGGLNHIGVVVDDLDATEAKVKARGYAPHNHADYEPGRRFYFREENGIEIEVVSYG